LYVLNKEAEQTKGQCVNYHIEKNKTSIQPRNLYMYSAETIAKISRRSEKKGN